jgi:ABC-type multidrug transport system fused ATPase/permease subunit
MLAGNQLVILVTDLLFALGMTTLATWLAIDGLSSGRLSPGGALSVLLLSLQLLDPIDHIGQFFYVGMGGIAATKEIKAFTATHGSEAALRALSEYGEQFAGHFVAFRALALLRVRFYERLEPQAPAAVSGKKTGDLLSRVTRGIDRIEVFFAHTLAPTTSAVLLPLAAVIWILCVAPLQLALPAILIWALMALAVPRIGAASSLAAARQQRRDRGEIAQHITDSAQGLREVLAFDAGPQRLEALDELGTRVAEDQAVSGRWSALRRGINTLLTLLLPLTTLLIGLPLVSQDRLGLPILLAILAVTLIATKEVLAIEEFLADLDQAFASAARVRQIFDRPPETPEPEHPRPAPQGPVDVRFEEVHFAYPAADPSISLRPEVLHGINLEIRAGETVALVGASGSGKSTLAALLSRGWAATAGHIRLGGVEVRELADADLRTLVSVVPQRPYLFNTTIAHNLRLARLDATDDDLRRVCAQVSLDREIEIFPKRYETVVGEQGSQLSGGQRQRLAIARALPRDTPVLVFDEVTSELDADTQQEVSAAIASACRGRTALIIAHRVSTVSDADRIVVMDAGQVVQEGPLAQLAGHPGPFTLLTEREASE